MSLSRFYGNGNEVVIANYLYKLFTHIFGKVFPTHGRFSTKLIECLVFDQ